MYGVGTVLLRAIAFLLLPLYTRFLTPADYGVMAVTGTVGAILTILFPLGLHGAVTRFYFNARTEAERKEINGTILIGMVIAAVVMALATDRLGGLFFPLVFRDVPFTPYIRIAIWTSFLTVFGLFPLNLLQTKERAGTYVLATIAGTLLNIALVICLVVFLHLGVYGYLMGTLVASLIMTVPYALLSLRNVRLALRLDVLRSALAYSLPLVPHGLASWVLDLSDRVILQVCVLVRTRPLWPGVPVRLGHQHGGSCDQFCLGPVLVPDGHRERGGGKEAAG